MARPTIYTHIAEQIRSDIALFADGRPIPSLRTLARRHGASYNTVRKALGLLAEQHEVHAAGPGRRHVRRRRPWNTTYCKPYPAVALLSLFLIQLNENKFMSILLRSFVTALTHRITVAVPPGLRQLQLEPVPGGVLIEPPGFRFSAVAFRSGAPPTLLAELVKSGTIVMALDCLSEVPGVDSVAIDCAKEADTLIDYLCGLAHQRVACLLPRWRFRPPHWPDGVDPDAHRFSQAAAQAKRRRGMDDCSRDHILCDVDDTRSDASVSSAIERLWRREQPPTALICGDPSLARLTMEVLHRRNVHCPRDVSIVTRGMKGDVEPSFTALVSDPVRIGTSAALHMHSRLTSRDTSPAQLLFASSLVEGSTTAPPPVRVGR